MSARLNIAGDTFGRLTAVRRVAVAGSSHSMWLCLCDCGVETVVALPALRSGNTRSCGCLDREALISRSIVHGRSRRSARHPLYMVWLNMRQRCQNENRPDFVHYGGRGITVDPRWDDFAAFLEDVGERPPDPEGWDSRMPYWTLDRIDPDGNYEPGNVRWATWEEQRANRRDTVDA